MAHVHIRSAATVAIVLGVILLSWWVVPDEAHAIPAFARKHNVTCTACHTAVPILNTFGERFLENGYRLPGTEDDGFIGKKKLGEVTLDDVTNYLGFRVSGNVVRSWSFARQNPPGADAGVAINKTEFTFPDSVGMFTAGTLAKNIGFFVENNFDVEDKSVETERAFATVNNLGWHNAAHLRVGKLDPSAFSSYAMVRQQLQGIGAQTAVCAQFSRCAINRAGLEPLAFAAKFYGLYQRDGTAISPFASALYHAESALGIDLHGRPFGDWFLYQVGILNGANEGFGDTNKGKDVYGMVRFDYARSHEWSANLSGFVYVGNSNAKVASQDDVNWNRYGLSARATYQMVGVYGAFTIDKINKTPAAVAGRFDATASGLTIGADVYVTDDVLISARYDNMDAGGMLDQRTSVSFVGVQLKYFVRSNVMVFLRDDVNVRGANDSSAAARNLRNAFFTGVDIVF